MFVAFGGVLALLVGVGCSGSPPAKEASRPAAGAAGGGIDHGRSLRPRARLPPRDRAGRAECQGAAAIRGEAAEGRAERHRLADRRHRLRPFEHVRRRHAHADARSTREAGPQVQPLPHHGALFAHPRACSPGATTTPTTRAPSWRSATASRATPARGRSGLRLAEILRQNGYSTAAFGKYHETAPWEVQRVGAVRSLADPLGVRQVLRLHRRRDEPVGAARRRRHRQDRGSARPELPLHDRHDQPGRRLDPRPAVAHAGQAVLHVLRHRRHPRPASRAEGVDREVQGPVRRRLGQVPRGDVRPPEEAGHRPREREAGEQAHRHQGLGQAHARRAAAVRAADGGLRRVRRAHRQRDRPRGECDRGHGRARQHDDPVPGGRQRRQRRRRHVRHVQRDDLLQRRAGDGARHASRTSTSGEPGHLPAHGGGLGRGRQHAVHVDEAGRGQLRRHAQPAGRHLAQPDQGQGRDSQPVPPRDRHRADRARGGRSPGAKDGQRHRPDAHRRRQLPVHVRRRQGCGPAQDAVLRDLRQPRHLPRRMGGRDHPQGSVGSQAEARAGRRRVGALQRGRGLQRDQRSRGQQPGQAEGAARPLHEGGGALPRAADRRPVARTLRPRDGGASGPDGGPEVAHGLRGHDGHDGERLHQREEPVGDDHGRRGHSRGWRQRRDPRPGRPFRRLEPLRQGRQAGLHVQLGGTPAVHDQRDRAAGAGQGQGQARVRLRRQRPRQGRHHHDLRQRQEGRNRPRGEHQRQHLLGRRRRRRGRGRGDERELGVRAAREQVHREDREGAGRRQVRD